MKKALVKVYITAVVPNIIISPRVDVGGPKLCNTIMIFYSYFILVKLLNS